MESSQKLSTLPTTKLGLPSQKLGDLIRSVKNGLPFDVLEALSAEIGVTISELGANIGVPSRTLARRKVTGKLSVGESEHVVRLANLFQKARMLFNGDVSKAQRWMRLPKKALGGESPLEFSSTELGAREVENLIGRLEHGVFS
nr:antitoxin Xre/MbcA/ParS toxin-binding domain-containing protein [Terracidiphilus gabretensis]